MGFCLSGFFWGYLAGGWKSLDFLQPGRHTYAFFTGLTLASGAAMVELRTQLRVASAAMGAIGWTGGYFSPVRFCSRVR